MALSEKFRHICRPVWISIAVALVLTGCSLSSPSGGSESQATIEGAPRVVISSPLPNATFLEGTVVNIMARIENAGPDIATVKIQLNGELVGEVANPNASGAAAFTITQSWPTSNQGQYIIGVVAERADGSASDPANVTVNIIKQAQVGNTGGDSSNANPTQTTSDSTDGSSQAVSGGNPTQQTAPTTAATQAPAASNTPAPPTNTPEPTLTFTPSKPMAKITSGANLRRGPSTVFDPPVGSIAANAEAEILAVNPARDWYKIRYYNSEAWIFANLVSTSGDLSSLPVDAGPPTPIPATATPLPTATPIPSQVNLYVVNIAISPHPLKCGVASEIQVTIGNNGTSNAPNGGKVKVEAILSGTGAVLEKTDTIFGAIEAGKQQTVSAYITVSTNYAESQKIQVTIDSDGQVAEGNEGDNVSSAGTDYILDKAKCP